MQTLDKEERPSNFFLLHSIPGGINMFLHSMRLLYDNNHLWQIKGSRVGIKRHTRYTVPPMSVFIVGDIYFFFSRGTAQLNRDQSNM